MVAVTKMFSPVTVGRLTVPNRFFMAPLTRCRADLDTNIPNDLMREYYTQRAPFAGLIISEFTTINNDAVTFHTEGCIADDKQAAGWKKIVDSVHAAGGHMFCQLAHGGRAAHPLNNDGKDNVSASPIALTHTCNPEFNPTNEKQPYTRPPVELTDEQAREVVEQFRVAARRAVKDAGFDGVEIHGANGYLIDQFLCASTNKREAGRYAGASLESRTQFLRDVLTAVCNEVGADRVGLRISPLNSYQDMSRDTEEKAVEEVKHIASICNELDLAYMHVMRADFFGVQTGDVVTPARETFKNTLIVNMGFSAEEAEKGVTEGKFDAVAFGTNFLANPDYSERIRVGYELNDPKPDLFYTKKAEGYTDYPFMPKEAALPN